MAARTLSLRTDGGAIVGFSFMTVGRIRSISFARLIPFFFLRARTLISANALVLGPW
jgi:hypothetical protein